MLNSKERFSNRVDDYVKYRPSYPAEVIAVLKNACGLSSASAVADIGSGTGILTNMIAPHCRTIYAVEPNQAMRAAAELVFSSHRSCISIDGSAEHTTLADSCVDIITAAQAFHWFDKAAAKTEFSRIVRSPGFAVLIWNDRKTGGNEFQQEYELLLRTYMPEYKTVTHKNIDSTMLNALYNNGFDLFSMPNVQRLDRNGLLGRLASSSYAPKPGDSGYAKAADAVNTLFDRHADHGAIMLAYETKVYVGRIGKPSLQ